MPQQAQYAMMQNGAMGQHNNMMPNNMAMMQVSPGRSRRQILRRVDLRLHITSVNCLPPTLEASCSFVLISSKIWSCLENSGERFFMLNNILSEVIQKMLFKGY